MRRRDRPRPARASAVRAGVIGSKPSRLDQQGKPAGILLAERTHFMAVEVEDPPRLGIAEGDHDLGEVPRVAGDVGAAQGPDVLDDHRPSRRHAATADAVQPDRRARRTVAAGAEDQPGLRRRRGIDHVDPQPGDAGSAETFPEEIDEPAMRERRAAAP